MRSCTRGITNHLWFSNYVVYKQNKNKKNFNFPFFGYKYMKHSTFSMATLEISLRSPHNINDFYSI